MALKIELLHKQRLEVNGFTRTYQVGEEVAVGRATAERLISLGVARMPQPLTVAKTTLKPIEQPINISLGNPNGFELPHGRSIIWDGLVALDHQRVSEGIRLLDRWEVAAPLMSYEVLARDIGTPEERERTQAVIRDLRVPVYETGLIFVKHTPDVQRLLRLWKEEDSPDGDTRLAFLRALYQVKPLVLALPITWAGADEDE